MEKLIDDSHFERFWSAYPRKVAKGRAKKAWAKWVSGMSLDEVEAFTKMCILALDAQKLEKKKRQDKGEWSPDWKHGESWLNGECWGDDIEDRRGEKIKIELAMCEVEGCGNKVHGKRFQTCEKHTARDCYEKPGSDSHDVWNMLRAKFASARKDPKKLEFCTSLYQRMLNGSSGKKPQN